MCSSEPAVLLCCEVYVHGVPFYKFGTVPVYLQEVAELIVVLASVVQQSECP